MKRVKRTEVFSNFFFVHSFTSPISSFHLIDMADVGITATPIVLITRYHQRFNPPPIPTHLFIRSFIGLPKTASLSHCVCQYSIHSPVSVSYYQSCCIRQLNRMCQLDPDWIRLTHSHSKLNSIRFDSALADLPYRTDRTTLHHTIT